MLDARSQQIARAPHDSMHGVTFLQEQFRQIGTVLASDSGNQGNFLGLFHLRSNHVLPSFIIGKKGNGANPAAMVTCLMERSFFGRRGAREVPLIKERHL
jgi:hypothetical protein